MMLPRSSCITLVMGAMFTVLHISFDALGKSKYNDHQYHTAMLKPPTGLPQRSKNFTLLSRNDPLAYRALRAVIAKNEIDAPASELERFNDCPVTTQVRVILDDPTGDWILQSQHYGSAKSVGGDEYYVSYIDNTMLPARNLTAAAFVHDRGDGSYRLDFYESSINKLPENLVGRGTVTVYLQYTCNMGRPAHPYKDKWSFGGAINIDFSFENVTMPSMKKFVQPNANMAVDLGAYKHVVYHGDSITRQLANKLQNGGQEENFKKNAFFKGLGCRSAWNMDTLQEMKSLLGKYKYKIGNGTESAIILGSSVWDLLARHEGPFNMTSHLQACQLLLEHAKSVYPFAKLYWRSVTAIQVHEVAKMNDWMHFDAIFYVATSRANDLYLKQKELIEENLLNSEVTFLNFYDATYLAADWLQPGDGRHYSRGCNKHMIDWYYITPNVLNI